MLFDFVTSEGARAERSRQKRMCAVVDVFTGIIRRLVIDLSTRYPNDAVVYRAKRQIVLAISLDPIRIVKTVGHRLYQYRDQIYAGNDEFFVHDEELERFARSKTDEAAYIIPKIKEAWGVAGEAEKVAYREIVKDLLDAYVEYQTLLGAPEGHDAR
jgi:hypothetical protein